MNDSVLILQKEIPEIIKKMEKEEEDEPDEMPEYEHNYDLLFND